MRCAPILGLRRFRAAWTHLSAWAIPPVAALLVTFALLPAWPAAATTCAGDRVALIIANKAYPDSDTVLSEPAGNAASMARALRALGFRAEVDQDLTRAKMDAAIERLQAGVTADSIVFLFFSGFGLQTGGHAYLLPVDAAIWSERDIKTGGLDLDRIVKGIEDKGAKAQIVVIDGARRNPFERRFRPGGSGGLAAISGASNLIALYSTAPNAVLDASDKATSPFMDDLTREMTAPNATVEEAFKRTRGDVSRVASRSGERPWTSSSLSEDLKLDGRDCGATASSAAPAPRTSVATAAPEPPDLPVAPESPPPRAVSAPAPAAPNAFAMALADPDLLEEARDRLYEQNLEPGAVGSPAMREAIRKYETDAGLPGVEQPTAGLLDSLRAAKTLKPWGAIAVSNDVKTWGMAWGAPTRREAMVVAKSRCGSDKCTRAVSFFRGQCGAFAVSARSWSITWRDDGEASRQAALDDCARRGAACHVVGAVCADGSEKTN
jgi:hypothetical protein